MTPDGFRRPPRRHINTSSQLPPRPGPPVDLSRGPHSSSHWFRPVRVQRVGRLRRCRVRPAQGTDPVGCRGKHTLGVCRSPDVKQGSLTPPKETSETRQTPAERQRNPECHPDQTQAKCSLLACLGFRAHASFVTGYQCFDRRTFHIGIRGSGFSSAELASTRSFRAFPWRTLFPNRP